MMSLWRELNSWPLPYQGSALPLSYKGWRAEDGSRTRYLQLGRLSLYQMSYFREAGVVSVWVCKWCVSLVKWWGEEDSNLRRLRQQIYSLPHLTALESPLYSFHTTDGLARRWICPALIYSQIEPMGGFEPSTGWLQISCSGQLSYIGILQRT